MSQICQNYLDLTGDLETVAYLACEYPFLEKYYANYKQALALAFEQKALDKI